MQKMGETPALLERVLCHCVGSCRISIHSYLWC